MSARSIDSPYPRPKVSVHMNTYNHERFIKQAIESVLMQRTDFPYELVIGEDCSKDGTRELVLGLYKKHPEQIRLLLPPSNLGTNLNYVETYAACRGKYVATLDGDDYWTSPFKLQKQVDFLDTHPDFSMCFHRFQVSFDEDFQGDEVAREVRAWELTARNLLPRPEKGFFTLDDVVFSGGEIGTLSVMFRKDLCPELPSWFGDPSVTDLNWPLQILLAARGKVGLIDEVMGVYRVHAGGWWSSTMNSFEKAQGMISVLDHVNTELGFHYDKVIEGAKSAWHMRLALDLARKGNLPEARKFANMCTAEYRRSTWKLPVQLLIVMWLSVYLPGLFNLVLSSKTLRATARRAYQSFW